MKRLEHKLLKMVDCDVKLASAEGSFAGYASVFGGIDSYNDTVMPGAYLDSLKVSMPAMYFNHVWRRSDMPAKIGRWTVAREDAKGLYVEGMLTMEHPVVKNSWPSIKDGLFDGLSIGYYVPEGGATIDANGVRHLLKVDLGEVSLVEEGADPAALVSLDSIKSLVTIRDLEDLLRDAGMSKTEALATVAAAKGIFAKPEALAPEADPLLVALQSLYLKAKS